jgi:hypothetical protein
MAENSIYRKKVCDDLKIARARLFARFSKRPMNAHLWD